MIFISDDQPQADKLPSELVVDEYSEGNY